VQESGDDKVIIRHEGNGLAAAVLRKDGHLTQQDIESNKYLARVLEHIRESQLARDEETLRNPKLFLRQKERLRADMALRKAEPRPPAPLSAA
jgi:hypothetical protein